MADRVVSMGSPAPGPPVTEARGGDTAKVLQRKCACGGGCSGCKQDDDALQRKAASSGAAGTATADVHPQAFDSGASLDKPTRSFMESRFDADFSDVRIHTGTRAAKAARSVNALAYTVGRDIVFGEGQFAPSTTGGKRLLAHELTHVLQQLSGRMALQRKEDETPEGLGGEPTVECPPVPTGLGNMDPAPPKGPCPRANYAGTNRVSRWLFCTDSDQIHPSDSLNTLPGLIAPHPRATRYLVHGHSSIDGNADYNFRLSCHRAHKVGDALLSALTTKLAGTATDAEIRDRVQVASRGATNEFPGGPQLNRVAVLYAEIPGIKPDEEPACKDAPRRLGDIRPEVECDVPTMDLTGQSGSTQLQHFQFCLDSDVLFGATPATIKNFAGRQAASATYVVHGFASTEGDAAYNQRLSCHRARRVARELMNAGVRPEQIREVSGVGETDAFSFGVKEAWATNRVAVVLAEGGGTAPLTEPPSPAANKQDVVDAARNRIMAGQYESAADFYISFWTCGRTATVRQAVERLTVSLPGGFAEPSRNLANGGEEDPQLAVNHVRISNTALRADNPVECTMGRLIDMAFHHAVKGDPSLPAILAAANGFGLRHQAGLHLITLAGLGRCKGKDAEPSTKNGRDLGIDTPVDVDPLKDAPAPGCARSPQPTRLLPPTPGEKNRQTPQFEPENVEFILGAGTVSSSAAEKAKESGIVRATQDADIVSAAAEIRLIGKPEVFGDYEVGFVQNIIADQTVVEYASGHTVIQQLPVPIRLTSGPDEGAVPAPWATSTAQRPSADGTVTVKSGARLPSVNTLVLHALRPDLPHAVMDRAVRKTTIATWLVARRLAAPLDRYSLHVLAQHEFGLTQTIGLEHRHVRGLGLETPARVGGETELPVFSGTFDTTQAPMAADLEPVRLLTPVAADIDLRRQTSRILDAAATTETGGVDRPTYANIVRRIFDELVVFDDMEAATASAAVGQVVPRLGFVFSPLTITIPVDRRTGRTRMPKPATQTETEERVALVVSPELDRIVLEGLDEALSVRIGNPEFLRTMFGRDVVLKPTEAAALPEDRRNPGKSEFGEITVFLPPLAPAADLWDFAEVRQDMARIWACTEATIGLLEDREFAIAYRMDRALKRRPSGLIMGECCGLTDSCKTDIPCARGIVTDNVAGFAIGTVHSHPQGRGLEAAEPSASSNKEERDDRKMAAEGRCGRQHYIVSQDFVFQYFTEPEKTDNHRPRSFLPQGEKCPIRIPPCE